MSVIRNETGINEGMDVENYGAELELLLNPPSVPGLTFNFMMSYITSEIGNKAIINPADLGGHYAGTAASKEWHAAKGQQANTYLIKKKELGVTSMKVMDLLATRATRLLVVLLLLQIKLPQLPETNLLTLLTVQLQLERFRCSEFSCST